MLNAVSSISTEANMSKGQTLTADNLHGGGHSDHGHSGASTRRHSIFPRDNSSEGPSTLTTNPSIRRMSRWEPRHSVQYRRMSQASRSSVTGSSIGHKHLGLYPVKLQNTYRLEPKPDERFRPGLVHAVIKEVLEEWLAGETYSSTKCPNFTQNIADLIKNRVKEMGFHRYKLIVMVNIGQDLNQGVQVVSRSLWNEDTDNFAEAYYKKDGIFAVATVYAIYFE